MKKILYYFVFLVVYFVFFRCENPVKKQAHKHINRDKKDSVLLCKYPIQYYTKDSSLSLRFCQNEITYKNYVYFKPIPHQNINLLLQEKILPLYSYAFYPNTYIKNEYQKLFRIVNSDTIIFCFPAVYEVILKKENKIIRQVGRLYRVGFAPYEQFDFWDGVYMSDTTKQFGWFVLNIPYTRKTIRDDYMFLYKHPIITSLDSNAQVLCGEYKIDENKETTRKIKIK